MTTHGATVGARTARKRDAWELLHAAGGRRHRVLVVWRQAFLGGLLLAAGATAIVLLMRATASTRGAVIVPALLAAAIAVALADCEARLYRTHRARAAYADRFLRLYRTSEQRRLTMDEENELWAIAVRRLHLCSWQRLLAFEHGSRPRDDAFLRCAYAYLGGTTTQLLPGTPGRQRAVA